MEDNVHDVVKLLLARMKSHPEEFASGSSRWGWMVNDVMDHCSKEEAEAIKEGLRPIRLQEIHEHMMDELCNGDERRRKEQEEYEYEKKLMANQATSMGASLRNALSPALQRIDEQTYAQQMQAQIEAYRNTFTPNNTGLVATMKKALGI